MACDCGDCTGKECGDDGCLGSCGTCEGGKVCREGLCISEYPVSCLGMTEPSAATCPEELSWEGCCDDSGRAVWCSRGQLFCVDCPSQENPYRNCGWVDAESGYFCGGYDADPDGLFPRECPCIPQCNGKVCGDDGCGGSCGACPDGQICQTDECVPGYPAACLGWLQPSASVCPENLSFEGCCDEQARSVWCQDGLLYCVECAAEEAPYTQCGWYYVEAYEIGFYTCADTSEPDPDGNFIRNCDGTCVPQCTGKVCGADGCGGTCGTCDDGKACHDGQCVGEYPESCLGEGEPSAQACPEGMDFVGCCDVLDRVVWCNEGKLYCLDCPTLAEPANVCGWIEEIHGTLAQFYACGGEGEDPTTTYPRACACTPECMGKECGDDGCGGTCGTCTGGAYCQNGECTLDCKPECTNKQCGDDGCGGTCGTCASGFDCRNGACVSNCVPDCAGKECGDDGCGDQCGKCPTGLLCNQGLCVSTCTPDCQGKECGDDGCGSNCPNLCGASRHCEGNQCVPNPADQDIVITPDAAVILDTNAPPVDPVVANRMAGGCTAGATGAASGMLWLLAPFAALVLSRRRPR